MYSENTTTHPLLISLGNGHYRLKYTPFSAHVRPSADIFFTRPPTPGKTEKTAIRPSEQPQEPATFEEVREYLQTNELADGPSILELLEVLLRRAL
jgi:hypothetical protein